MSKSRWDSNFWRGITAIASLCTILGLLLGFLQYIVKWNVHGNVVAPIADFLTMKVPLYYIPLAFIIVVAVAFVILLILGLLSPNTQTTLTNPANPLANADILDDDHARFLASLCMIPRSTDFLKQRNREYVVQHGTTEPFEYYLKQLEERDLLSFNPINQVWSITPKAIDYIAKYHG